MNKVQQNFIGNVIIPRLVEMSERGNLPSNFKDLHPGLFARKVGTYNRRINKYPNRVESKQIVMLTEELSLERKKVAELFKAVDFMLQQFIDGGTRTEGYYIMLDSFMVNYENLFGIEQNKG